MSATNENNPNVGVINSSNENHNSDNIESHMQRSGNSEKNKKQLGTIRDSSTLKVSNKLFNSNFHRKVEAQNFTINKKRSITESENSMDYKKQKTIKNMSTVFNMGSTENVKKELMVSNVVMVIVKLAN